MASIRPCEPHQAGWCADGNRLAAFATSTGSPIELTANTKPEVTAAGRSRRAKRPAEARATRYRPPG
jgi:hypothetical protein